MAGSILEKDLAFPVAEFEGRLTRVRRAMQEAGLDALLVMGPEDLFYLTGYRSMGYFAWQVLTVTEAQTPVMLSRVLEERIYHNNSWLDEYVGYRDEENPVEKTIELINELGLSGKRIGIPLSNQSMAPTQAERLKAALPGTEFVDTTTMVAKVRWVKSPAEIECTRRSAALTRSAIMAAVDAAEAGRTENDLAAAFTETAIRAGSERTSGVLVGSGPRSTFGHASWENRRLEPGDMIFIEGSGCIRRYHAAAMRSISIGEPSAEARMLEQASIAGANAALAALKPGVTSGEVDAVCRGAVRDAGAGDYFRHRAGYSIGIGFSSWIDGFSLRPHDETPISAGMVVHIVPFLSTPQFAVALSETALVTDTGAEKIVNLPQQLWVK